MLSGIKRIIPSPSDLIAVYLFTVYHYVRYNVGWQARKFYLAVVFLLAVCWELIRLIRSHRLPRFRWDSVSVTALLMGASVVLTAVFSKYGYLADDRKHIEEGAIIWCVYLAIFLWFRREYVPKKTHLLLFLLSGYIECLMVIITTCIFNLFGPNSSIYGNYNLLGLGMSIFYSLNLMLLADENDVTMCLIHYILAFFFSLGIIFSRSDNALLCIAALLGVLPFVREITADLLKKLLRLAAVLLLSMAAAHLLSCLPTYRHEISVSCLMLRLSLKISPFLTAAAGIALIALQMLIQKDSSFPRLTKILRICVATVLFVVTVCLLLTNVAGTSFGAADEILRIDDSWGTGRGRIWRICLLSFRDFASPLQKLFGTGINSTPFFTWYSLYDIVSSMSQNYITPHNFLIQLLLEGGICGLILFCLFCFLSMRGCLKRGNYGSLAVTMVTIILAGSLVTVTSPDITPYFFVFLSICATPEAQIQRPAEVLPDMQLPAI